MKYIGMPLGMWFLFKKSFCDNLVLVLGMTRAEAKLVTKQAKPEYKRIISKLPAFEKGDRFKMNIVNCAMFSAFYLHMPEKPDIELLKGMIYTALAITALFLVLFIVFGLTDLVSGALKTVLFIVFLAGTVVGACVSFWMIMLYRAFSYNGKRKMSKQIIDGIAEYVTIPDGGKGLDVGCGSGALSIVMSNYVYHNILSNDRQAILLETLRTLKKGGTFAIHDIFSKSRYGDMQAFVKKLKDMGYEKVELIDTTNGKFMSKTESIWMELSGSALLVGRK